MMLASSVVSAVAPPCARAASTAEFSQTETHDSSLLVTGRLDPNIRGVWIHISRPGHAETESVYPEIRDGRFTQKVFLRDGRGQYHVSVRETTEPKKRVRTYFEISQTQVQNLDPHDRQFLLPSIKVQSDHPSIKKLAGEITQGAADRAARSRKIHDWIASNIAYDAGRRLAGRTSEKSALQALLSRKAFCNGYAHLNAALHRAAGIPARVVLGWGIQGKQRELHEWNEVLVDGKWQPQDVTWDAGGISMATRKFVFNLSTRYFLPSLASFRQDHHKIKVLRHE